MSLRVENLGHVYQSPVGEARTVLHIPAWTVQTGEQLLIRGVSGSGKTTLFNILAGLLHPTQGTVWYDQQSLYALPEEQRDRFRARQTGYVFQNHHLLPALTALENVVMPMAFARSVPAARWRTRARDLLAQVGLADYLAYRPGQLSTGQRLRVALARALANTPRLLLADEPTAALDAASGQVVMDLLQTVCHEHNAMLLVASHDPAWVTRFAQVLDLTNGGLIPAVSGLSAAETHPGAVAV